MRAFPTDARVSDGFRDATSTSIDVNISFGFTQRRRKDAWTDERRVPRLGACSQFAQVFRPAAEVDEAAVTVDEVRDDRRRRDATMSILLRDFTSSREGGRRGERVNPRVGTADSRRLGCGGAEVQSAFARDFEFFNHDVIMRLTDGDRTYE